MNDEDTRIEIAVAGYTKLQEVHSEFLLKIAANAKGAINGGSLSAIDGEITASALGVHFDVVRRPIFVTDHFVNVEYAFVMRRNGVETAVWHLYLDGNSFLYTDSAMANYFTKCDDTALSNKIVAALASALIKAKVFEPRG